MRENHCNSSKHLGLIKCLTPPSVGVTIYAQTLCETSRNSMQVSLSLPHTSPAGHCPVPEQPKASVSDVLQALTFEHRMVETSPGWPLLETGVSFWPMRPTLLWHHMIMHALNGCSDFLI